MTTPPTLAPIMIETLYFDGLPNHEKLVTHLAQLLKREGVTAETSCATAPTPAAVRARPAAGNGGNLLTGRVTGYAAPCSFPGGDLASTWLSRGDGCESRCPGGLVKHPGKQ